MEQFARVISAPGFIEPCLPTVATRAPTGDLWIHEIKHDGYRLMVRRHGDNVRIFTRRGADWTDRFPAIVHAARKIKAFSFYMDGEGVVCRDDGLPVSDLLHSNAHDDRCLLYAFDLIELNGDDLRKVILVEQNQAPQAAGPRSVRHCLQRSPRWRRQNDLRPRLPAWL
jgi:ATP-dependent DNA ligase